MNNNNPLVSVIIPVYNGGNYIGQAIESALNQTYSNIEIIVVNDGSKDNTEKICKSYGKKIRYYSKENGGVATALNFAISKMKGEYFSWLSHDDLYYTDKIERQIKYINEKKLSGKFVLYANYNLINEDGYKIASCIKNHEELVKKPEYSLLRGNVNGITMLIPKKAFEECGLFNVNLKCTQDYDLWLTMMNKYKFIHMPQIVSMTRIHSKQDTQANPKTITEGNELWIKMMDSITKKRKIELEGTVYNYYKSLYLFLKETPYDLATQYASKSMNNNKKELLKYINKCTVSVIIPFYNRIELVHRAVSSVLNQKTSIKEIEIILVDDCSTDDISSLKMYEDKKNIKYYKTEKNLGPSAARNLGIKKSSKEFIAFLDSDDEFVETKIQTQIEEMLLSNGDVSYTNYYKEYFGQMQIINCYLDQEKGNNELIYNNKIATPTVIVKSNLLKKQNIYYNENIKLGEDAMFYLDIAKHAKFIYVDDVLSIVHQNASSSSNVTKNVFVGLKNLIKFIINDELYSNYDKEISLLYKHYLIMYDKLLNEERHIEDYELKISNKAPLLKKIRRKLVPLQLRKYIKKLLK